MFLKTVKVSRFQGKRYRISCILCLIIILRIRSNDYENRYFKKKSITTDIKILIFGNLKYLIFFWFFFFYLFNLVLE